MLTSIFHSGTIAIQSVALILSSGLLLGFIISIIYQATCEDTGRFSIAIATMPLLVAMIIIIVNDNLGTSVAVLGAFGLLRFRSVSGSVWEIVFLFFSTAVGLALGMGFITLSIILTFNVSLILLLLDRTGYGKRPSSMRELKIIIPEDLNYSDLFDDLFMRYTKKTQFRRIQTTNMGTMYELNYRIELRKLEEERELIDQIRGRNGNLSVCMSLVE